jgi:xanthine dehydrogenase YagS FAD-binding subunit
MRPFEYARAQDANAAVAAFRAKPAQAHESGSEYLAGGTTLLDLMKLDVMRPTRIVDINPLHEGIGKIFAGPHGLRLGAMVRMSEAADHPAIRKDYPVIAQALQLAASPQIRNMASLGGNVLQRTRCTYFRDTSYSNCNKRNPGSGCAAIGGVNRQHAVLGVSDQCIATYPGDFAQALIALEAQVEVASSRGGMRRIPISELHRPPGDTPHIETTLAPGELITAYEITASPMTQRSLYLKVRDRESYEFALASAAVALDLQGQIVADSRIALGGVATVPWRAREAEAKLKGQRMDESLASAAAEVAFAKARPQSENAFKVELGKRTLVRALLQAATLES